MLFFLWLALRYLYVLLKALGAASVVIMLVSIVFLGAILIHTKWLKGIWQDGVVDGLRWAWDVWEEGRENIYSL